MAASRLTIYQKAFAIYARDALAMIQSGKAGWEGLVPERVAALIKKRKLLRYREPA